MAIPGCSHDTIDEGFGDEVNDDASLFRSRDTIISFNTDSKSDGKYSQELVLDVNEMFSLFNQLNI